MDLAFARDKVIGQTFREVLPGKFASLEATVLLLAIGLQESRFEHREQIGGPARSFWQFERGGGVRGVLSHEDSRKFAQAACVLRGIPPTPDAVYQRMLEDDLLGCAFARLLLYTDPRPLPALGRSDLAWDYYIANWRPGRPRRASWDGLYAEALKTAK
jgi:hypothetical protein